MNPINHVAIIMDGNGRWGIKNKGSRNLGHRAGLDTIEKIIEETINQNISHLTLYTFSTENWKRPKTEVSFLFELLENFLSKKISNLIKNKIRLKIIGNRKKFTNKLQKLLTMSEKKTIQNKKLQINLALNYGSKDELLNAIRLINKNKQKISEKNIENNLYTKGIPNPDLLIRTGNTKRLSNFLLWQLAYTEIFFEKKLWPEFNKNDYKRIINKFKLLKRNYGAIK
jgi:undecaprenyl diphosphate synthase